MTHVSPPRAHRSVKSAAVIVAAGSLTLGGCSVDKNSMLAPGDALISLVASAPILAINQTTSVVVQVNNSDGSPAQDGTEVLVSATQGSLDQTKVRTRDGFATLTYQAATVVGPVEVEAHSSDAGATLDLAITSAPVNRIGVVANPHMFPAHGGQVEIRATVLSDGGQPVMGAPVTFSTSKGTVAPGTVFSDANGLAIARLTGAEPAIVKARIHQVSSDLSIQVEVPIGIQLTATPSEPRVGDAVTFSATPSENIQGTMTIHFGDGQFTALGLGTGRRQTTYAYAAPGGHNVTAVFQAAGRSEARETIRVEVGGSAPAPPAPDLPSPVPPDPNLPFSMSDVGWLHTDVSRWAETSRISTVSFSRENGGVKTICFPHSKAGKWPIFEGGEGNVWVLGNIGGRWYAGTFDWLKKGQTCKTSGTDPRRWYWEDPTHGIGAHVHKKPLEDWYPRPGEQIGIMVSTHARFGQQSIAERSNVYLVRWP